ncbi:UvrD-like helicase, ATP-binding domain, P-loop containing nucleoside triphosphate hydrolase [Tanacetum coccineum]
MSKPMFDYWKKRGLVQVRKLDDSVDQAMRVASSPQEWRERGKKLFYENNFVMAKMCFERAGDTKWEKLAKASGLKASAQQMLGTNSEAAFGYLRDAGDMFESIGKHDSAATCYCDSGNYRRAAQIYLDKCGRPDAAAECFLLAKCYSDAAEVYASGNQFSNCLSVCKKAKLYDEAMGYLEYWKQHVIDQRKEIEQLEQEFLESCALDYHDRKDTNSTMKYVRAFCTMESKRVFLRSIGCLDYLLVLEEEAGNFLDAAKLVRSWGDVLKEADFLEKAGQHGDASLLLVLYVFFSSLWGKENRGWPLEQFPHKEEICKKAKSLAEMGSEKFYHFVCSELKVLSNEKSCLSELKKQFDESQKLKSLKGQVLTIRKLLDAHLCLHFSEYEFPDEAPIVTNKYVDDKILRNRVSVETLIFCWNTWKANIVEILQGIRSLGNEELNKHGGHVDFALSYFGVRKQCVNANMIYLLVIKDADWLKDAGDLHRDGKIVTLDLKRLVFAMRSYWQSELQCVGVKVLETLEDLHNVKRASRSSVFQQNIILAQMFEVSKFLLDCKHLNLTFNQKDRISTTYFHLVFPLDWRKSISGDLISARETHISLKLLEDIFNQEVNSMGQLNYYKIGKVMMICLSSSNSVALNERIFNRLEWNPAWGSFFEIYWNHGLKDVYVAEALRNALDDTYRANWRLPGYISPHSFVYLLDYLSFRVSSSVEVFFTTKSSFVGWFRHNDLSASKPIFSDVAIKFLVATVKDILYNKTNTVSWIERSGIDYSYYHPLLALKLVMILSLICLQVLLDCMVVGLVYTTRNV